MPRAKFDDVLEAIDRLPLDEQADLVEIVRRRVAEQGRRRVVEDVREGRAQLAAGNVKPARVDEIMREIES